MKKVLMVLCTAFALTALVACAKKTQKAEIKYTYNSALSASPTKWNPLSWESNSDSIILGYVSTGFYDTVLNENKDNYEWVCEMASAFPVDVTENYVGQYGIAAGDKGKVWKVALNQNATWDDGTKITADDYIYSMKQQLDPEMLNRRADSYTTGSFTIFGAKNYLYSKTATTYELVSSKYDSVADAIAAGETIYVDVWDFFGGEGCPLVNADGTISETETCPQYLAIDDDTCYFDLYYEDDLTYILSLEKLNVAEEGEDAYYVYYDEDGTEGYQTWTDSENNVWYYEADEAWTDEDWEAKIAAANEKYNEYYETEDEVYFETKDDYAASYFYTEDDLCYYDILSSDYIFCGEDVSYYIGTYLEVGGSYDKDVVFTQANAKMGYAWEGDGTTGGVGLLKTGEYELTFVLTSSTSEFYVKYNLSSNWLVKESLYESCKTKVSEGYYTTTYCTSLETTPSYGPYKLTAYVADQYFTLAKNDAWYGYTDGNHEGMYQTTNIDYTIYDAEQFKTLAYQAFMTGELDDYGLDASEMTDYGASKYLYVEPTSYTYQFFVTTDYQALSKRDTETENHSVLSIESFRKAISFALSRAQYCSEFSPSSNPGFGIINYMYIVDPDTGLAYRSTEAAKRVSLAYAGFTEQEDGTWKDYSGTKYQTLEDAYEAITCYDVNYAKSLFQEAYEEAVKEGIYNEGQDVVILWEGMGSKASDNRSKLMTMFNEMLAAALPEGTFKSVTLEFDGCATEDQYWSKLQNGETDISMSGWGGSDMDPWTVLYGCYVDQNNSLNYKFDVTAKNTDVTVKDGDKEYTYSLYDWSAWLDNLQDDDDYSGTENLYTKFGAVGDAELDFKIDVLAACELAQLQTVANIPMEYAYDTYLKSAKYNNGTDTFVNSMIGFGGLKAITYNYTDAEWAAFVKKQGGNLESFYKG